MKLIISLKNKSEDFIHGMELGRLMERMSEKKQNVDNDGFPIRNINVDKAIELCIHFGYTPVVGESIHGWTNFMAIRNVALAN